MSSTKKNYWIKIDQATRPYYFNALTKQTVNKKPRELAEDEARIAACLRKQKTIAVEHVDKQWWIAVDNMCNWFWFNAETNESMWTLPVDVSETLLAAYHRRKASAENDTNNFEGEEEEQEEFDEDEILEQYELVENPAEPSEHDEEDFDDYELVEETPGPANDIVIEEQKTTAEPEISQEKMESEYCELLDSLKVNAFSMFDLVVKQMESDIRFQRLPSNKAKSLFNSYCANRTKETHPPKTNPRTEAYVRLLEEKVNKDSRWEIFQHQFRRDARFKQLVASEREKLFKKYLASLKQAAQPPVKRETENERREKALEARKRMVDNDKQKHEHFKDRVHTSEKKNAREALMMLLMDYVSLASEGSFDDIIALFRNDTRYQNISDVLDSKEQSELIESHFKCLFQKLKASFAETLEAEDFDIAMSFREFQSFANKNMKFKSFEYYLNDLNTRDDMEKVYESVMRKKQPHDVIEFRELLIERRSALVYKFISAEKQKPKMKQEDMEEGYDIVQDAEAEEETIVPMSRPQERLPLEQRITIREAEKLLQHDQRYHKLEGKPKVRHSLIQDWISATAQEYASEKFRLP